MAAQVFTPVDTFGAASKEKEWPINLGMLDWDSTRIVFTKRELMEFLKYTGTTVDPNFSNIQKLPRYAQFGSFKAHTGGAPPPAETVSQSAPADAFKPSRRVREAPGGAHTPLYDNSDDVGDALSMAPPKPVDPNAPPPPPAPPVQEEEEEEYGIAFSNAKPSRRVREAPGGNSSLSSIFGGGDDDVFKPTRRVRQNPGGQDSLNDGF